jgi:hypothetical protein
MKTVIELICDLLLSDDRYNLVKEWVAVDSDGGVYTYEEKPMVNRYGRHEYSSANRFEHLGNINPDLFDLKKCVFSRREIIVGLAKVM